MQTIPMPEVLDPDRVEGDTREEFTVEFHKSRADDLSAALHESCAYAQQLWRDLDAVRRYLVTSLPPAGGDGGAAPHGPADLEGWRHWADAYAAVTSVLAGPHGDSGFGREEAAREAAERGATV